MNMPEIFFQHGRATDRAYVNLRDRLLSDVWAAERKAREFCEELWDEFRPYADRHFLPDAMNHFQQRFWEMYLGVTLLRKGFGLVKDGDEGPEFYFMSGRKKVWVEAVAPGKGEGPDAVPEKGDPPEKRIILRYTHALLEKLKKYKEAVEKGIVGVNDCFVVAINGRDVWRFPSHAVGSAPIWVRACLPFGDFAYEFDRKTQKIIDSFSRYRDTVDKVNDNTVSTRPFLEPEYAGISGVIHSAVDWVNRPGEMGSDFEFLHNPLASQPIDLAVFSFCRQYRFSRERGELQISEHGK